MMGLCVYSPIWNETLTWDNSWPEFTPCFLNTVLVLVPCGWLWLTLTPFLLFLLKTNMGRLPTSPLSVAKIVISLMLAGTEVIRVFSGLTVSDRPSLPNMFYVGRTVEALTFLLAALLAHLCTSRGIKSSGILFVFWMLVALSSVIPLYTYILREVYVGEPFRFYSFVIQFPLIVVQLFLQCFAEKSKSDIDGYNSTECPEVGASFLSKMVFWWMTKIIYQGFRKPLEEGELWELHPRDVCQNVLPHFERAWARENERCRFALASQSTNVSYSSISGPDEKLPLLHKNYRNLSTKRPELPTGRKPSVFIALAKTFYPALLKSYLCKILSDVLQFVSPLLLSALIDHIEKGDRDYTWKGYVIALGLFLVASLQSIVYHQHYHYIMVLGMRMKTTLMATIYKKAMRLNCEAQKASTVGEIVNLMAVDCQRIQDMMSYTWMVWSIPFQVCLAVYLLWSRTGPPVLAGLLVLILLLPINAYLAYKQQRLQRLNLTHKDRRIKLLNEILSGIKVLKLYAWELCFKQQILNIREREMNTLMRVAYLKGFSTFIWTCAPYLVAFATFAAYVLTSEVHLDAQTAFVTLSLFNILQFPINFIPEMITNMTQARVSLQRLDKFLLLEELDPNLVSSELNRDFVISIYKGTYRWDREGKNILSNISMSVCGGEFVAVIGQVGAGKTSLLSAILGEMHCLNGTTGRNGSVAYVAQEAWIQNATLRDNILFGKPMENRRYKKVIEACALQADLDMLPGGDMTEIGEKGINLSGGQKQRINLARAVYADADIYLFDDPLSAVDSHVGKHIFKKVLSSKGVLREKTRVLVTHAVHWLPLLDNVVVLSEGKVIESGSYAQMMSHDGPFAQLLKLYLTMEENDSEKEEDPEIRELKQKMFEHVEFVTSQSEGATSGDEYLGPLCKKLTSSLMEKDTKRVETSKKDAKAIGHLIDEEKSETGKVKVAVFSSYLKAVGVVATFFIFLLYAGYTAASIGANIVLSAWTEDMPGPNATNITGLPVDQHYLTIYGLLGGVQAFFVLIYAYLASIRLVYAAKKMHADMLDKVVRSPMSFFDTTPLGRIINRFARDVEVVDNNLPRIMFMFVTTVFSVSSTLLVISVNTPLFITMIVPLFALYFMIQRFFVPSSRQLKRMEACTRSPIFSHFSESLSGAYTIRAYRSTERFIRESIQLMDKNQIVYFAAVTANRWLGIWIEFVSSCVVLAASVFSLVTPNISGGAVGLSITYALQITQSLKWMVRTLSDLETNVVSVERIREYSELRTEAEWIKPYNRPNPTWPETGNLQFKLYTTRYRTSLPLTLRGVNCDIKGGEKIGIVGRTGAGKSSLSLALFRIVEAVGGSICLDGVTLEHIGLFDLRSRITILPQDPVLFSGTLRMNLDPFERFGEDDLWTALEHAHLKPYIKCQPGGLDFQCGEGGSNLSVGQRQLVCLARALLKRSKLLVLDEATAAVDLNTDNLIQQTIRNKFADSTVLTIAHRLHTVMDYDRIMVMNAGEIEEFDQPHKLLANRKGLFYSLAKDAGLV